MTKQQIVEKLQANHLSLIDLTMGLNETEFLHSANGKWAAGQHLEHIYKSVSPVTLAFRLPKLALKLAFGKANRPSRTYDELVAKYRAKLAAGGVASSQFVPKTVLFSERQRLKDKMLRTVKKLSDCVASCSETDLEAYVIPHPLLGKLTLREMLYFTVYHAQHHQELVIKYLQP